MYVCVRVRTYNSSASKARTHILPVLNSNTWQIVIKSVVSAKDYMIIWLYDQLCLYKWLLLIKYLIKRKYLAVEDIFAHIISMHTHWARISISYSIEWTQERSFMGCYDIKDVLDLYHKFHTTQFAEIYMSYFIIIFFFFFNHIYGLRYFFMF